VALAVAGALAVATVGLGLLLRPWSQTGRDTSAGSDTAHPPAPSATAGSTGGNGDQPGTVPARYLGTWEGQATGLGGALPMGTFRLTVQQARVGQTVGHLRQTDRLGAVCDDTLFLKKVTRTQILATSVGAAGNHAGCNQVPHQVELTPVGDDLKYTSDSSEEGNPVSRMARVR
jgi:hypothetical protein